LRAIETGGWDVKDRYNIQLKISEREVQELITMYGKRLGQFQCHASYIKWNAARLSELVALVPAKGHVERGDEDDDE
jgi:hypothetical protein